MPMPEGKLLILKAIILKLKEFPTHACE